MARLEFKDLRKLTLQEVKELAIEAKDTIQEKAQNIGRAVKVYMHWTAGWWNHGDDDYHLLIDATGCIYTTVDDLNARLSHTAGRNSGAIGISLCACALATSNDLGENPPTDAQIECLAMLTVVLANALEIPIDLKHVMTHGEAADNLDGYPATEPYGPDNGCERWDLAILKNGDEWKSGGDILRGKANWYNENYPDGVENHF